MKNVPVFWSPRAHIHAGVLQEAMEHVVPQAVTEGVAWRAVRVQAVPPEGIAAAVLQEVIAAMASQEVMAGTVPPRAMAGAVSREAIEAAVWPMGTVRRAW